MGDEKSPSFRSLSSCLDFVDRHRTKEGFTAGVDEAFIVLLASAVDVDVDTEFDVRDALTALQERYGESIERRAIVSCSQSMGLPPQGFSTQVSSAVWARHLEAEVDHAECSLHSIGYLWGKGALIREHLDCPWFPDALACLISDHPFRRWSRSFLHAMRESLSTQWIKEDDAVSLISLALDQGMHTFWYDSPFLSEDWLGIMQRIASQGNQSRMLICGNRLAAAGLLSVAEIQAKMLEKNYGK